MYRINNNSRNNSNTAIKEKYENINSEIGKNIDKKHINSNTIEAFNYIEKVDKKRLESLRDIPNRIENIQKDLKNDIKDFQLGTNRLIQLHDEAAGLVSQFENSWDPWMESIQTRMNKVCGVKKDLKVAKKFQGRLQTSWEIAQEYKARLEKVDLWTLSEIDKAKIKLNGSLFFMNFLDTNKEKVIFFSRILCLIVIIYVCFWILKLLYN